MLQTPFKAGEIAVDVDINSNEYSFLKTNKIDDLPALPYATYLVRFLMNKIKFMYLKINKFIL